MPHRLAYLIISLISIAVYTLVGDLECYVVKSIVLSSIGLYDFDRNLYTLSMWSKFTAVILINYGLTGATFNFDIFNNCL